MSNYNKNKQNQKNDLFYSYKNSNQTGERSTVTKDEIQILGTKPSSNYPFSPFGREIFVPHAGQ